MFIDICFFIGSINYFWKSAKLGFETWLEHIVK